MVACTIAPGRVDRRALGEPDGCSLRRTGAELQFATLGHLAASLVDVWKGEQLVGARTLAAVGVDRPPEDSVTATIGL